MNYTHMLLNSSYLTASAIAVLCKETRIRRGAGVPHLCEPEHMATLQSQLSTVIALSSGTLRSVAGKEAA